MKQRILISLAAILFIFSSDLLAKIQVISVTGKVAYKNGKIWVPLRRNQVLPEGVKISSGTNSYAKIRLNQHNHTIDIKPMSFIKIFSKESNSSTNTHIGLKRGKIRASIVKNQRVKTVFKISTPVATSSVRGTVQEVSYGPDNGMEIRVIEGIIEGMNRNGRGSLIKGKLVFRQRLRLGLFDDIFLDLKDFSIITFDTNGITQNEIENINSIIGGTEQTSNPEGETDFLNNSTDQTKVTIIWN